MKECPYCFLNLRSFASNLCTIVFRLRNQCPAVQVLTLYKCYCSFDLPSFCFSIFTFMDVVILDMMSRFNSIVNFYPYIKVAGCLSVQCVIKYLTNN